MGKNQLISGERQNFGNITNFPIKIVMVGGEKEKVRSDMTVNTHLLGFFVVVFFGQVLVFTIGRLLLIALSLFNCFHSHSTNLHHQILFLCVCLIYFAYIITLMFRCSRHL